MFLLYTKHVVACCSWPPRPCWQNDNIFWFHIVLWKKTMFRSPWTYLHLKRCICWTCQHIMQLTGKLGSLSFHVGTSYRSAMWTSIPWIKLYVCISYIYIYIYISHKSEYTPHIFVNILLYLFMGQHYRNETLMHLKVVSVQFVL